MLAVCIHHSYHFDRHEVRVFSLHRTRAAAEENIRKAYKQLTGFTPEEKADRVYIVPCHSPVSPGDEVRLEEYNSLHGDLGMLYIP